MLNISPDSKPHWLRTEQHIALKGGDATEFPGETLLRRPAGCADRQRGLS